MNNPVTSFSNVFKAARLDLRLGPMIAIADEANLLLLEFTDRQGLKSEIVRFSKKTKSTIVPGRTKPIDLIEQELEQYFRCGQKQFDTPISLSGSDFQKSVWRELIKIPPGETRSYADIAQAIDNPSAFRAVARANSANQLAIIVPCHRVINKNGKLGGYASGIARKEWLINHERNIDVNPDPPSKFPLPNPLPEGDGVNEVASPSGQAAR